MAHNFHRYQNRLPRHGMCGVTKRGSVLFEHIMQDVTLPLKEFWDSRVIASISRRGGSIGGARGPMRQREQMGPDGNRDAIIHLLSRGFQSASQPLGKAVVRS